MNHRKLQSRNTPNKQNIDCHKLETSAQDKLHTFSQDLEQYALNDTKQQFSGWLNDSVLIERVNKVRKRPTPKNQESIKLTANKMVLERRWRRNGPDVDCKTGIILLKKECEYLQSEREETDMIGTKLKSKFPKKEDIIIRVEKLFEEEPYKVKNNFFCTRDRYSAMESNRKKIKGLKKLSLAHADTNTSLRPNTTSEAISRQLDRRPFSSTQYQSDRLVPDKLDTHMTIGKPESAFDVYNSRQIHAGFKRCRMNKRNRSARLSFAQPSTHLLEHLVKGKKINPKPKRRSSAIVNQ